MNIEKIRLLAEQAHAGQFRNDGKTPYITHPFRVAETLAVSGESEEVVAATLLHDVWEDNPDFTTSKILPEISYKVRNLIGLLTHYNEDYEQYIIRISKNEDARKIKIADILDNLSDTPSRKQVRKYAKALKILVFRS